VAVPRPDAKDAKWADPKLVAEVQFTTWTREGRVRHPSFKGLREDKPAKAVKREMSKA
jgi:bifunctional non-homologous end joining protein LigD